MVSLKGSQCSVNTFIQFNVNLFNRSRYLSRYQIQSIAQCDHSITDRSRICIWKMYIYNVQENRPHCIRQCNTSLHSVTVIKFIICSLLSVTETIPTGISCIKSSTLLGDNMVVICGDEDGVTKIKSYNLTSSQELQSLNLKDAYGLAEVKLNGKLVLAVSYRFEDKQLLVKLSTYILCFSVVTETINIISDRNRR